MLYQAATGAVGASEISRPWRDMLRRQRNARVILGEAIGIDSDQGEGGAAMRFPRALLPGRSCCPMAPRRVASSTSVATACPSRPALTSCAAA